MWAIYFVGNSYPFCVQRDHKRKQDKKGRPKKESTTLKNKYKCKTATKRNKAKTEAGFYGCAEPPRPKVFLNK
jgi:hypothetical protein